jgi:rod shape-determining protein MreD
VGPSGLDTGHSGLGVGVLVHSSAPTHRHWHSLCFGILLDVHQGSLLGQHAISYTMLGYLALLIHRRLLWFSMSAQAVQVLPLFIASHAIELIVRLLAGGSFPGLLILLPPVLESLLWPVISVLLLSPQRRPPNPDAHRPL